MLYKASWEFPRGVFVVPCFCVPFFLKVPNESKSRRHVSRCRCGYVGTISEMCLTVNCLTDRTYVIVLCQPERVPIWDREYLDDEIVENATRNIETVAEVGE